MLVQTFWALDSHPREVATIFTGQQGSRSHVQRTTQDEHEEKGQDKPNEHQ